VPSAVSRSKPATTGQRQQQSSGFDKGSTEGEPLRAHTATRTSAVSVAERDRLGSLISSCAGQDDNDVSRSVCKNACDSWTEGGSGGGARQRCAQGARRSVWVRGSSTSGRDCTGYTRMRLLWVAHVLCWPCAVCASLLKRCHRLNLSQWPTPHSCALTKGRIGA
jgi:hypothetical protein